MEMLMQAVPIPAHTLDIGSILMAVATVSVAVNGFFLRSVARRIETMDERQQRHADRLTWLEAHARTSAPHRRRFDARQHDSGDYMLGPDDDTPGEGHT